MRIYLDNCCYNRPYDDQSYMSIHLETQSKLFIQKQIRDGKYQLVTSEILIFEIDSMPFLMRKSSIMNFVEEQSSFHIGADKTVIVVDRAHEIMKSGIKYKDACHLASAIIARCQYFITTDKRILNYQSEEISIVNPIDFIRETENNP